MNPELSPYRHSLTIWRIARISVDRSRCQCYNPARMSVPALRRCHIQAKWLDVLMKRVREAIELHKV